MKMIIYAIRSFQKKIYFIPVTIRFFKEYSIPSKFQPPFVHKKGIKNVRDFTINKVHYDEDLIVNEYFQFQFNFFI